MSTFADAFRALGTMKTDGVIDDNAIAGAMALMFWSEPIPTYDLDVLVILPSTQGALVSLETIYRWGGSSFRYSRDSVPFVHGNASGRSSRNALPRSLLALGLAGPRT